MSIKRLITGNLLALCLLAMVTSARAQNSKYVYDHKIIATVLSKYYGIPAPVILAVAAIESSGGNAPVAKVLNNHFGMVGRNELVNHRGHKSRYKQYSNEIASYLDFCGMITRKHFYARLKDSENCLAWVKAMSRAGYSEVPEEWEQKVMGMLNSMRHTSSVASK